MDEGAELVEVDVSEEQMKVRDEILEAARADVERYKAESVRWQARIKELERRMGVIRDVADGRDCG
jgi:hypothetical protein